MANQNISSFTATWNSGGTTYNGIKLNVTDAASASDSKLFDFQIGGASKGYLQKDGTLALTSTTAGAAAGPSLTLFRDIAAAAANVIGQILWKGRDGASNTEDYAAIDVRITDPTSTSEDAEVRIRAKVAGTMTTLATFGGAAGMATASRGFIYGLTLSNNGSDATNDIDIATGSAASEDTIPSMMTLTSTLTKRLDAAWAVGSGNGGLDTGSIANTTYFMWLIQRSDTGVVDVLFSAHATSPTMPSNYDRKRRIGIVIRASGALKAFKQDGDRFILTTPVAESPGNVSNSWTSLTLTGMPNGIALRPLMSCSFAKSAATPYVFVSNNDTGPAAASATANTHNPTSAGGAVLPVSTLEHVYTNTSQQIRAISDLTAVVCNIQTLGWVDMRGQL